MTARVDARRVLRADNVYGVLPKNGWMVASIVIMLIHQIIAYALCESLPSPAAFMEGMQCGLTVHSLLYDLMVTLLEH